MLLIVLSGPKTSASQARNALASAGFQVIAAGDAAERHHGLPDSPVANVEAPEPVEFVTVRAEEGDLDRVAATGAPLRFVLRSHRAEGQALAMKAGA